VSAPARQKQRIVSPYSYQITQYGAIAQVEYRAEPEALQYRESMTMPDEDYEFIKRTAESVVGESDGSLADEE
jgi:hypothetical protein